jgi:CBS domain-containing protein
MYASKAMSTKVIVCKTDSNLEDISRLMWENNCGAIPVVDGQDRPVGIVTDRDIAMTAMLNHKPLWELNAGALTEHQHLCSASEGDTLEDCLTMMEHNEVRRLPVIDDVGAIAGILSIGDAVAFASKSTSKTKQDKSVPLDRVMGMLQHVSAHH